MTQTLAAPETVTYSWNAAFAASGEMLLQLSVQAPMLSPRYEAV